MNKEKLTALIMSKTDTYKKTHLLRMHKADLEAIASPFLNIDELPAPEVAESNVAPIKDTAFITDAPDAETVVTPAEEETVIPVPRKVAEPKPNKTKKKAKEPIINETEKLMLATIPHLPDFANADSVMNGKGFLKKV